MRLWVADTGEGIPQEDLERIFDRFWRSDTWKSGTGLGLAIVKHMVQALGGTLELGSREGVGTTFSIRLQPVRSEDD